MTTAAASTTDALKNRFGLWPMRVLWFVLPICAGVTVGQLLETRSSLVSAVVEVFLWAGWFGGLVSLLAPSTVSLTFLRIVAPVLPIGLILNAFGSDASGPSLAAAILVSLLAAGATFLPQVGDMMVNGSAYGAERRLALRAPAGVLIGPIQVAWLATVAGAIVGPLLLATRQWALGAIATAIGLGAVVWGARVLHQLSRRWIVFVPVGFVIHDYYGLAESILLQRKTIAELGPAPATPTGAADLSAGAMGLALQVELKEPTPIAIKAKGEVVSTTAPKLIFTPSLPGKLLAEARARGLKLA